jgi:DNA-binding transcriptional ArsR family regulator
LIDRIRQDLQQRLESLLGEADKLRRALAALGSHDDPARRSTRTASPPPATPRRRARSASTSRSRAKSPAAEAREASKAPPVTNRPAETPRAPADAGSRAPAARNASGATRSAVLAALAGGDPMTAAEIASATGLGRATVSTTLSRLAKSGQLTKAPRGYKLAAKSAPAE